MKGIDVKLNGIHRGITLIWYDGFSVDILRFPDRDAPFQWNTGDKVDANALSGALAT